MGKWDSRLREKSIAVQHLKSKKTEDLLKAKKFMTDLLELRNVDKLYKTYVQGVKKSIAYNEKNKVFVDFRMEGTTSGRLSCAGYKNGKNPMGASFHTLPREKVNNIRNSFVAPQDWVFVQADYSAMELRVLAHLSKEENMRKAFREGLDLHTYSAQLTFKQDKITKEQRQLAKTTSFLIVYGGGAFNLSQTFGMSVEEAQRIIDSYFEAFPGIPSYMDFISDHILEHEYAYTIFGRRRHLVDVRSKENKVVKRALRQGINFTIQSTASDVLLVAMISIALEMEKLGMKGFPVATVHDSIEIVCPKDEVQDTLAIMRKHMVEYPVIKDVFGIDFEVPLEIEAEIGPSFGKAKAVGYNEFGMPIITKEELDEAVYLG